MESPINKEYLGDGVYAQYGFPGTDVLLTTEDGISISNRIYVSQVEIQAFIRYCLRHDHVHKDFLQDLIK